MGEPLLLSLGRQALLLMMVSSLPPILASLLVGLVVSLLQASTQVHESTLSVVPKLCAAVLTLVLLGPWIGAQLTRFTTMLLLLLPRVGK
jgi:flagellar biosynthetic protein FliQ